MITTRSGKLQRIESKQNSFEMKGLVILVICVVYTVALLLIVSSVETMLILLRYCFKGFTPKKQIPITDKQNNHRPKQATTTVEPDLNNNLLQQKPDKTMVHQKVARLVQVTSPGG